jgi:uncharacterized protein YcnI
MKRSAAALVRPLRGVTLAAAVVLAVGVSPAGAHVQVSPSVVAPGDSVRFTVLVPGESGQPTTRVELKVPAEVLPFAFSDPPGWKRRNVLAANGALDRIVWTGRMAPDGFAEFSFLAGTPERAGELSWRALQAYADGTVVRWIGPPDSEEPAAVTRVAEDAPRQNAGGESAAPKDGDATETASPSPPAAAPETVESESSSTDDWFARALALVSLAIALAAVALALRGRAQRAS